jgi:hypothetical protein
MVVIAGLLIALALPNSQRPVDAFPMSLRRERMELVRARYAVAADQERRALLAVFDAVRSAANPDGAELGVGQLDAALRALGGQQESALTREAILADALALRVVPGAFESRTEGLGEATTVSLTRTRDVLISGDPILSLFWIGPDGEEQRARREVIPRALVISGAVELFIRPPLSAPGTWQLVCEVGLGETARRGLAVDVDCVADLGARREALAARPRTERVGWTAERALEELCLGGLRHPVLGARALLKLAEDREVGAVRAEVHGGAMECQIAPSGEASGTLVLVGGSSFSPIELLCGAAGAAWRSYAEAEGLRVIALDLPLSAGGGRISLAERLAELREDRPEDALHLAAFGDAAGSIPSLRARHPELPLDSVALVSDSLRRIGRDPRLDVNTILVECSGDPGELGWSREEDFGRVLIREPFLLSGALLPDLMIAGREAR